MFGLYHLAFFAPSVDECCIHAVMIGALTLSLMNIHAKLHPI